MSSSSIWFTESIEEAVKIVTEKNLILLVYVFDDSEKSKKLDEAFNDEHLVAIVNSKAIALKMQKDSHEANLFGQLYPIHRVPLVYFILQGTVKDFGVEDLSSQDIVEKINKLSPSNDIKAKLEEVKKTRAKQEEKQTKERELKRRQDGKLAQETIQSVEEKQNKIYFEKLKKERKEDEEYKKKIKEQIAKDRAVQMAARKAEKQRLMDEKEKTQSNKEASSQTHSDSHNHCNLNIKQLDGSSVRHSFSSSNRLSEVVEWIDINRTDSDMPYKLFAQFPNRNFDISDEQRTLLDLKLCPSATLIMKPIKNASTAYSPTTGGSWVDYLYSAGNVIYNSVASVTSYLVTPTTAPEPGQRLGGESSSSRQHNVRTLSEAGEDDDSKKRQIYNGNSVNQE
ncbi:MAG: ubiquitin-related domain-containing protein [Benjaminiella poitrasii]|nr:MAG: ubiquitin-related domain-containing protein [Benjaminiella poitrasii]